MLKFLKSILGSGPKPVAEPSSIKPLVLAPGRGFTQEVVGESHRQEAFELVMGPKRPEGFNDIVTAQLVFDDGNEHDPNAVGVLIETYHVGYIPRADAALFREQILNINPEELPVTCKAKIVGGWLRDDGDEGSFGIKLSVSSPLRRKR